MNDKSCAAPGMDGTGTRPIRSETRGRISIMCPTCHVDMAASLACMLFMRRSMALRHSLTALL